MPGSAKTSQFFFSTATVMVGTQAEQLTLNAATNSIGLVKNVAIEADPGNVDLTQGIMNDLVMTMVNSMNIKVSMEVYEYTAKNLAYGLSLDGTGSNYAANASSYSLAAAVAAAATTLTVATDLTTTFTAGSWIFIQEGTDDVVHLARVISSSFASPNTTITFTGMPVPTGMSFTTAGRVGKLNKIDFDPNAAMVSLSVRIIGTLATDKRPIGLHFPKVKVTKGFSMRFAADNFGNLPFEFTPYSPISTDSGYNQYYNQRMHVFVP